MKILSPISAYNRHPSFINYPGHLSAVLFTKGCNFKCPYCYNLNNIDGQNFKSYTELCEILDNFKDRQWISAVTVTGGEPTLHKENLIYLLKFIRTYNLKIKLDTNGSDPTLLKDIIPLVDYIAMDLKCPLKDYPSYVQFKAIDKIKESLDMLKHNYVPYEIRTTIEDMYHSDNVVKDMIADAGEVTEYVIQPFRTHKDCLDITRRTQQDDTTEERMNELKRKFNLHTR